MLSQRNYLDWMQDLDSMFKLQGATNDIISIAVAEDLLIKNVLELADREVDGLTCEYLA